VTGDAEAQRQAAPSRPHAGCGTTPTGQGAPGEGSPARPGGVPSWSLEPALRGFAVPCRQQPVGGGSRPQPREAPPPAIPGTLRQCPRLSSAADRGTARAVQMDPRGCARAPIPWPVSAGLRRCPIPITGLHPF